MKCYNTYLASFLPTSSAAALALCSHSWSRVLGTQYWDKLREPQAGGREDFLSLKERDLPDHIFCERCVKLHLPDRRGAVAIIISREQRRPCFQAAMSARADWYYSDRLRFEHVQIAMKQHRLGLNSSRHVDHQSNTVTHGWRNPYAYQISMKARIVSNSFVVRAQDRLLTPTGEVVKSLPSYFTNICAHLTSLWRNDSLSKMLLCRLGHLHDHHTCPKCMWLEAMSLLPHRLSDRSQELWKTRDCDIHY